MLVALTIDDLWHEATLDILEEEQVTATFFPVAKQLKFKKQPSLDRLVALHEIGNHTLNHIYLTEESGDRVRFEIKQANLILEERFGVRPTLSICGVKTPTFL